MKRFVESKMKRPFRFPINLQYFAEGGEGGGEGNGDGGDEGGSDKDQPFASFKTKEELNKRLGRAERKGQSELAKELGFDSVDAMKEALGQKDKKTDKKDDKDAPDVNAIIEEKLKAERQATFKRLVTAEVKVQASELGFADWEDALSLADLSELKEDDKGNITGVKEALEALAKKKPHLMKQQKPKGGFGAEIPNRNQQQGTGKDDLIKMAQNRGSVVQQPNDPWAKR